VAGEDGGGAVELFGEDEASDCVGVGEGAEREDEFGAEESVGGPAVGGADGEDDVLDAFLTTGSEPRREEFGGHGLAMAIEEDGDDGGTAAVAVDPGEEGFFGFEGLGFTAKCGGTAFNVAGGEDLKRVARGVCRAEVRQGDVHAGRIPHDVVIRSARRNTPKK